ncbi:MAG: helix-turn-helix domain-containing protein [Melioribacteraceae bacterium]
MKEQKSKIPHYTYHEWIVYNINIQEMAKKLYSIIYYFSSNKDGCFAGNQYFSKLLFVDERTVSRLLAILEEWHYIIIKNKKQKNRKIYINKDIIELYTEAAHDVYKLRKSSNKLKEDIRSAEEYFLNAKIKYEEH